MVRALFAPYLLGSERKKKHRVSVAITSFGFVIQECKMHSAHSAARRAGSLTSPPKHLKWRGLKDQDAREDNLISSAESYCVVALFVLDKKIQTLLLICTGSLLFKYCAACL